MYQNETCIPKKDPKYQYGRLSYVHPFETCLVAAVSNALTPILQDSRKRFSSSYSLEPTQSVFLFCRYH